MLIYKPYTTLSFNIGTFKLMISASMLYIHIVLITSMFQLKKWFVLLYQKIPIVMLI